MLQTGQARFTHPKLKVSQYIYIHKFIYIYMFIGRDSKVGIYESKSHYSQHAVRQGYSYHK